MAIKFGTSGWRSVIARDFTFGNVALVTEAICGYLKTQESGADRPIIIGHDTRFMGEEFAQAAADVASKKGFRVLICREPVPTPAMSRAIISQDAAGAMNFTASHNPPEYQGIKFSTSDGAPALPDVTSVIEQRIESAATIPDADGGSIEELDPKGDYLRDLRSKVDIDLISRAAGRYVYDPLWGTGRGYLDKLLRDEGLIVETIHDWRDVRFGGQAPEPGEEHLSELRQSVEGGNLTLGLSTDGDADRFGVIDSNGAFISPNDLIALLADYLAESRGTSKGIARSVATSHMVDKVARARGLKIYETPVGFKFIGELIKKGEIILGGEESAGLSIDGHYPEKDGILACLLATEAVAARGTSLSEQLAILRKELGGLESARIGVRLTDDVGARLKERLAADPVNIGGRRVREINRLDGVKFIFDDQSWMLMRPSGTEPVVRIYAESETKADLEFLLEQGEKYLLG